MSEEWKNVLNDRAGLQPHAANYIRLSTCSNVTVINQPLHFAIAIKTFSKALRRREPGRTGRGFAHKQTHAPKSSYRLV